MDTGHSENCSISGLIKCVGLNFKAEKRHISTLDLRTVFTAQRMFPQLYAAL